MFLRMFFVPKKVKNMSGFKLSEQQSTLFQRTSPCEYYLLKNGGERGIRTLGTPFGIHSLSRRAPSAYSVISPLIAFSVLSQRYSFSRLVDQWNRFYLLNSLSSPEKMSILHSYAFRVKQHKDFKDPTNIMIMAEGVGFEPTSHLREAVFKTAALNHSAIPPIIII